MNRVTQIKHLIPQIQNIDRAGLSMSDQKVLQTTVSLLETLLINLEDNSLAKLIDSSINEAFLRNIGKAIPLSKQSVTLISKQLADFVALIEHVPILDWRDNKGRRLKDNAVYTNLYVLSHQLKHVAEDPNLTDLPEDVCQKQNIVPK